MFTLSVLENINVNAHHKIRQTQKPPYLNIFIPCLTYRKVKSILLHFSRKNNLEVNFSQNLNNSILWNVFIFCCLRKIHLECSLCLVNLAGKLDKNLDFSWWPNFVVLI